MNRGLKFLAVVVGAWGGALIGTPPAHANFINGWSLDLTGANGLSFSGGGTVSGLTNIQPLVDLQLNDGHAVVTQNYSGGIPTTFTETGAIQISAADFANPPGGSANLQGANLGNATSLYFTFNLNGHIDLGTGFIVFDGGTAGLFLGTCSGGISTPPCASNVQVGLFNDVPGSTGVGLNASNHIPSNSIALVFQEAAGSPLTNLFDFGGNTIDSMVFEFANIQASLDGFAGHGSSCPNSSNTTPGNPLPAGFTGSQVICVTNQGQLLLEAPEPSSLVLFGAGLLGLGFIARRHSKKQALRV